MTYAAQSDIEARYPGELAQAGPRDSANALDAAAIALALAEADSAIDARLRRVGWSVPLVDPAPDWVKPIAVDLALYLATPTALASQEDFSDRRRRFDAAIRYLDGIAAGEILPPRPESQSGGKGVYITNHPRLFGRGTL